MAVACIRRMISGPSPRPHRWIIRHNRNRIILVIAAPSHRRVLLNSLEALLLVHQRWWESGSGPSLHRIGSTNSRPDAVYRVLLYGSVLGEAPRALLLDLKVTHIFLRFETDVFVNMTASPRLHRLALAADQRLPLMLLSFKC